MRAEDVPQRVRERALSRWREDERGCHVSTYSTGGHGYAQIGWRTGDRRFNTVHHRVVWLILRGDVEDDMSVHHKCFNRPCVNVDHLEAIPAGENAARTGGRDWPMGQCANGHPRSDSYREPSGHLRCKPCRRAKWTRENEERKRMRRLSRANPTIR